MSEHALDKFLGDEAQEEEEKKFELLPAKQISKKIQKYNLEKTVIDLWVNDNLNFTEIAKSCNVELEIRKSVGDETPYSKVTPMNIKNYLDTVRDKLTCVEQDFFEQSIKGVKVVDKVKHLSALVKSAYERKQMIREMVVDSIEKDDKITALAALQQDRQNDQSIEGVVKTLSTLESKLKTYITVDTVKGVFMRVIDTIHNFEDIDWSDRQKLSAKIIHCIDFLQNDME